MPAVRARLVPLALASVLVLAACDGGAFDGPTSSPTGPPPGSPTASPTGPTGSRSPTASPIPRPIPPAWAAPIEEDLAPAELPDEALVPPGATLTARAELPAAGDAPDQVAVAYVLGDDPFAAEHGVAVWQRFPEPPAWSVVYAFVDPPEEGVLGIRLRSGDLTGDGHAEVLTFEDRGGSGGCGTWTVVSGGAADTVRIFKRDTCDAEYRIAGATLVLREAIYEPDDPHCCPSAFRTATLEWNGERFVVTDEVVEET
jgi:hypothetical protein